MSECPNCNTKIETGGKFCPECGEELEGDSIRYCAECGGEIKKEAKFCPDCGRPVESHATEEGENKKLSTADTYALVGVGLIMVAVLMPWGYGEGWVIWEEGFSLHTRSGRSILGILPTFLAISTGLIAYTKHDGEPAETSLTGSWGTDIIAFGVVIILYSLAIYIIPQAFISAEPPSFAQGPNPYDAHAGFPIFLLFLGGVLKMYAGFKKNS